MFQYQSLSYRGNIDLLPTSLPDPLEKEARFHRLRAFPFSSLQFELALALWCYTVANVAGKLSNKPQFEIKAPFTRQSGNEVYFFIADPVFLPKFVIPHSKSDENFDP